MAKEQKIQTKVVAKYNGHGIKTNKNVDISLKCAYDQLTSYIQLIQYLNIDVTITAKLPDEKPMKLGTFRVKEVKVDHDGEGQLKFDSMIDFVNADSLNKLVGSELIVVRFDAIVELEDEEDEDKNNEDEWSE